jgi:hypothetical protein
MLENEGWELNRTEQGEAIGSSSTQSNLDW